MRSRCSTTCRVWADRARAAARSPICGDLRIARPWRRLRGIDVVVHLAALSGVIDSVEDPAQLRGQRRRFASGCSFGPPPRSQVICASTGRGPPGRRRAPPRRESHAPSPPRLRRLKLAMEGYCSAFAVLRARLRHRSLLRAFRAFSGHKETWSPPSSSRRCTEAALVGDGTQERDYLFVGDLVRGVEAVIAGDITRHLPARLGQPDLAPCADRSPQCHRRAQSGGPRKPARRGGFISYSCDVSKARAFGFVTPTALPMACARPGIGSRTIAAHGSLTRMVSAD